MTIAELLTSFRCGLPYSLTKNSEQVVEGFEKGRPLVLTLSCLIRKPALTRTLQKVVVCRDRLAWFYLPLEPGGCDRCLLPW